MITPPPPTHTHTQRCEHLREGVGMCVSVRGTLKLGDALIKHSWSTFWGALSEDGMISGLRFLSASHQRAP